MNFNPKKYKNDLLFLPLGGANEIGMNVNLYHLDGKWIMIDCGLGFAQDIPGIDMMTADISFIKKNKKNLLGIVLTHIHEDHIGAVQYLWDQLEVPVYATNFAANFLRTKLEEFNLHKKVPIHIVDGTKDLDLDPFKIQFVGLTHSVPEMKALIIKTHKGNVLHTGDWKFDPDPVVGDVSEKELIKSYGDKGEILAMTCDSTNSLSPGHSRSEGELHDSLKKLIEGQKGYVGVASFASNLARIQTIAAIAKEVGRKVVLLGFSLRRLHEVGKKSGYFQGDYEFISDREVKNYKRNELLFICTGCQGEPMAATRKIATNNNRFVKFTKGDTMIFSSKIIPGNEKKIFELFSELSKKEVTVITEKDHFVHVSGHPYQEELKEMYALAQPKLAIPVHGEYIHTKAHCEIAENANIQKAIQSQNGSVIKIDKENPSNSKVVGFVESGYFGIDGRNLIDFNSPVIKERRKLQTSGIVTVSVVVNESLQILTKPSIQAIGSYDLESDHTAQNIIQEEINKIFKQKSSKNKPSNGLNLGFLKKKKRTKQRNSAMDTAKAEITKTLRSKIVTIFEDLMSKRPAVEVIIHIV